MKMVKIGLAVLGAMALTSPALAEMSAVPAAAVPAMSPLWLLGLGIVAGVAGIRILKNRRRH
jgi:MYXO-CTERM domain-containing protein